MTLPARWTHHPMVTPSLHKSPLLPEAVAKDIRATVGCAVRTIPNRELRLSNGAHGAPYIAFTTLSGGRGGRFLEFTVGELQNHVPFKHNPYFTGLFFLSFLQG
jgi:hypothetical protein